MKYNLVIEGFGKIKEAKIQILPLTLITGDNNSGKSYLLNLIWALHSVDSDSVLLRDLSRIKSERYKILKTKLIDYFIAVHGKQEEDITISVVELIDVLNDILLQRKNVFVTNIFNDSNVKIDTLRLELLENQEVIIKKHYNEEGKIWFSYFETCSMTIDVNTWQYDYMADFLLKRLILYLLNNQNKGSVFLPASRIGFMLAKDVINKVSRQEAFGVIDSFRRTDSKYEVFTKSIIEFLNIFDELVIDSKIDYEGLVDWIENNIIYGSISYEGAVRREVRYLPYGEKEAIPLRRMPAAISGLSALILALKYHKGFDEIFYEEPEICCGLQLQLEIAKLFVRIVNEGIRIVATTHSSTIIQYISNMCELANNYDSNKSGIVYFYKVAIYQVRNNGKFSIVESIV